MSTINKMKAAVYVRVSTTEQAVEGYSVGVQKEKLCSYAKAQGYDIFNVYSDEGVSGKSLMRPAVEQMINDIKSSKINIVLIYKLDRLSRRVKDVLELVELFEKYNVTLYSLNENLDLSSPFGRAALKMSATFSELERETIVERMEMGKSARARSGKYSCPGKSPFGYKLNRDNGNLETVPEEAEAIRDMFNKYISGEYSFRKLYDYCKNKYPHIRFFSNAMSCKPIIERPMYAGYYIHKGELVKGVNFEPIISYETYLMAQEQVKRNTTKRANDNSPYLLTGLIVCGRCGRAYCGKLYNRYRLNENHERGKEYRYTSYGCSARIKYDSAEHGAAACDNDIFPSQLIEDFVQRSIMNLKFEEDDLPVISVGLLDKLLNENIEFGKQKERLLDIYISGALDKETYLRKIDGIDTQINKNKLIIEKEQSNIEKVPVVSLDTLCDRQAAYPTASKKEKQLLLWVLIKQIVVNGENVVIHWRFK